MGRYVLLWIPMLLLAVANGALRELWLRRSLSELRAHQVSTLTLLLLFAVYIGAALRFWPPASQGQAFTIGLVWLGLTLAFEFLFGHYASGLSWGTLLHDYNVPAGRVWVLVPVWVLVAPPLFFQWQR